MADNVREMTFDEEYEILQKEKEELFATEKEDCKPNFANCVVRRALRCIRKLLEEIRQYREIGTLEEVRDAVEKQTAKKPIYRHYENAGEPPYIKIDCPNGYRIQLHPVTDKHLAHEHDYCPKCGQRIDWSEEE